MAKKKTVKTMEVNDTPVLRNIAILDNPADVKRRALIKFDDANILKVDYNLQSEAVKVVNAVDGKEIEAVLGQELSYVPTLTINFVISSPLGESTVNLLKNAVRLIKRKPSAEFQLNSTYAAVEPEDESFSADNIIYRYTGASYIAYADFSNLSGFTVVKSDKVNCSTGDSATGNITITDASKDASITYTVSVPSPEPEPEPGE